jgi:hypothetical protein
MNTWTYKSYSAALEASNELVRAAAELNEAMGAGGGATSPEDVLMALKKIKQIVKAMKDAAEWA